MKSVQLDNLNVRLIAAAGFRRFNELKFPLIILALGALCGCQHLIPRDAPSLLDPKIERSEVVGIFAGFGTTFAALPDLLEMLKRRSSESMKPRMAAIMGLFQVFWIYYGLLILSRPVVIWNMIAVLVNSLSVGAYFYFSHNERKHTKANNAEDRVHR